jgi:DNA-binding NarL/FixJ family response regulator
MGNEVETNLIPRKPLSPREQQALDLMIDGPTMNQLAAEMRVSWRTSKEFTDKLKIKFGVENRAELIRISRLRKEQGL